jgi:molybdopterin molybdotransferase
MIGVDDARERILARFEPLSPVETPLLDALGLVIARDIVAPADLPPFRNSAMDGYALRAGDTYPTPATLQVIGTVGAGRVAEHAVGKGEAYRIMTGAPVPDGADAVVRFEETDEQERRDQAGDSGEIRVTRTVRAGENVREPGEDVRRGQQVIDAGTSLGPAEIGLLASLGFPAVLVHLRPKVAILATGDEVVDLEAPLRPGQIRNSNSYIVASLVRQAGGEPTSLGIARDDTGDLRAKLRAAGAPDLVVTTGGVSVGDYDIVKDVLREEGSVDIWQVRMKPGKPLAFGAISGTPLLGLPGNPVAALVAFQQFARPAIRRMLGRSDLCLPEIDAVLAERLVNTGGRRHFVRGIVERTPTGYVARSTGAQGSAVLSSVARGNCLIVVPEEREVVEQGTTVRVQLTVDPLNP